MKRRGGDSGGDAAIVLVAADGANHVPVTFPAPDPDPAAHAPHHVDRTALEARLAALAAAPRDIGRLRLIVRRREDRSRETPQSATLSVEEGVPGDAWGREESREREAQLTVMRRDVAEVIADGRPLTLFGDNLFVDLDLTSANLPVGTRLRVGAATIEVSPKPHNGCRRFAQRFGHDALAVVQAPPTRHLNLRGIYWMVVEPGTARVGDPVTVVRG